MDLEVLADKLIGPERIPREEETYPRLPSVFYCKPLSQKEYRKLKRKIINFLIDPKTKIDQLRQRLPRVFLPIVNIEAADLQKAWDQWLLAQEDQEVYRQIQRTEAYLWKLIDNGDQYVMKIPFFLVGIKHPLKEQFAIDPEQERSWLKIRKTVTIGWFNTGCYHYFRVRREDPIYLDTWYWLNLLARATDSRPELIPDPWRSIEVDFPPELLRAFDQQWLLGPVNGDEQIVNVGRLDYQVRGRFKRIQLVAPRSLTVRLNRDNLITEIIADLPSAIKISQDLVSILNRNQDLDFSTVTKHTLLSDPDCKINNRLIQDYGSRILIDWIFNGSIQRFYTVHHGRARPIWLSHAKNLLYNRCHRCNNLLTICAYDCCASSSPIGYNIYSEAYGYDSRYDYNLIYFLFPEDSQDVGQFCDNCIDLQINEGKAVALAVL